VTRPPDITDLGGSARAFPSTVWSVGRSWKPVYLAIRLAQVQR
jgi:hypothetical protein